MGALKQFAALIAIALLMLLPAHEPARAGVPASRDTLFAQSAAEVLNRDFTNADVSYLLAEAQSGRVLASRWENADRPIPPGSLVKPFTALAYAAEYGVPLPSHVCRGSATHCWRPQGHGRVDLRTAIAYSCNSYFLMLASRLNTAEITPTSASYGIDAPPEAVASSTFAGIGTAWRISPLRLVRAYGELLHRRDQPIVHEILDGMALSGRNGTGASVDRELTRSEALVKTGTAPCTHKTRAPGDGFAVALWPADNPRVLLLVRVHGVPGAVAAKTAGEMLHRIGE